MLRSCLPYRQRTSLLLSQLGRLSPGETVNRASIGACREFVLGAEIAAGSAIGAAMMMVVVKRARKASWEVVRKCIFDCSWIEVDGWWVGCLNSTVVRM